MVDVQPLPPPIPPEADLRDFPFMPLEVARLRRSKAWLHCKRQPALAFFLVNLWTAAWHERPAGSLEDDDDVLADRAICSVNKWLKVRAAVLRGWQKYSDDRLYHPVVTEKVLDAWARKLAQRERTLRGRIAALGRKISDSKDEGSKSLMQQQVAVLLQELSQKAGASVTVLSQTLSATSTEAKRHRQGHRQGQGERQGQGHSDTQEASAKPAVVSLSQAQPDPIDPDLDPSNQEEWLSCRAAYPAHPHPEADWLIAERDASQRVAEGERWSILRAGCERLARQQTARGNIGGRFVPSPKGMFTRQERRYRDPFPVDPTPAERRVTKNVAAATEFMRRTEHSS